MRVRIKVDHRGRPARDRIWLNTERDPLVAPIAPGDVIEVPDHIGLSQDIEQTDLPANRPWRYRSGLDVLYTDPKKIHTDEQRERAQHIRREALAAENKAKVPAKPKTPAKPKAKVPAKPKTPAKGS